MSDDIKNKQLNVFISYSNKDFNKAKDIAENCRDLGFNTWLDEDEIRLGENWQEALEKAISRSNIVFVLISKDSITSSWVNKEWNLLCEEKWKRPEIYIIPIILEDAKTPPFLCEYQAFSAEGQEINYEILKRQLARYLENNIVSNKKPGSDKAIKTEEGRLANRVKELKQSLEDQRKMQGDQKK
jgi:hypothetical protein